MDRIIYKHDKLDLDFYPSFLDNEESINLIKYIEEEVIWRNNITPYKRVNQIYADDGIIYTINYKGNKFERKTLAWTEYLYDIKSKVETITNETYTVCVIQRYPSGKVGINPHRDKEMKFGTTIAGLSLGETRVLRMSRNNEYIDISLPSGSLYVLNPPTNNYWCHSIPKDNSNNPRYSLTFRNY